jgi:hypothetical protein
VSLYAADDPNLQWTAYLDQGFRALQEGWPSKKPTFGARLNK